MLHPSISRIHALLIVDSDSNVLLIDPGSKAGTKINDDTMSYSLPYTLKNDQVITFGESTRTYKVNINFENVTRNFEQEKSKLEKDLKLLENLDKEDLDIDTLQKTLGMNKNDTIFVRGLIPDISEEDLENIFEDCGKIRSIRIPEDRQTRKSKGFAFITFSSDKEAKNALARDGIP